MSKFPPQSLWALFLINKLNEYQACVPKSHVCQMPISSPLLIISWQLDLCGGFTGGASGKDLPCQWRRWKRCGFNPWVRKIPWRRKWQPTPVFLPGNSMDRGTYWPLWLTPQVTPYLLESPDSAGPPLWVAFHTLHSNVTLCGKPWPCCLPSNSSRKVAETSQQVLTLRPLHCLHHFVHEC